MSVDKIYFKEGDVVTLKQDIPNKPVMVVEKVEKITKSASKISGEKKNLLLGIRVFWFDENKSLVQHRFNFKDLIIVKKYN